MCLAQFVGPLSGGHINCAVSFALFIGGRVSLVRCTCYTFSQMLGSMAGAVFLLMIFGSNWPAARAFGSNSWDESVFSGGQVFFAEMLGTMLLGALRAHLHCIALSCLVIINHHSFCDKSWKELFAYIAFPCEQSTPYSRLSTYR